MPLTLTPLPGLPLISAGDDLASLVLQALDRAQLSLEEGDILVLAQKIVSKAEGRLVDLCQVTPSPRALELAASTGKDPRLVEVILGESRQVLRTRPGVIIVEHRLGFVCASAGVDHSNVHGWCRQARRLGPAAAREDPDASAAALRSATGGCQRGAPGRADHRFARARLAHGHGWRDDRPLRPARPG